MRDALRGFRRRVDITQWQAGPLRFGKGIGRVPAGGFTLSILLQAGPATLVGLRDATLLSLAYDSGLRVAEMVRVDCKHIALAADGSAVLTIPGSKTDQEGQGAYAWLSPATQRRVRAWQEAAGLLFRRIHVVRTKTREAAPIAALPAPPGYIWRMPAGIQTPAPPSAAPATSTLMLGEGPLTPAAVRLIIKRTARRAADEHLVMLAGPELDAAIAGLSTHSLRVGLTQDLFASVEDAGSIAQVLRWTSTALRYGRKPVPASNATARMLRRVRG